MTATQTTPLTYGDDDYTITRDLAHIVAMVQVEQPTWSESDVHAYISNDWSEGREHAEWVNTAPALEIASWVLVGLKDAMSEREDVA